MVKLITKGFLKGMNMKERITKVFRDEEGQTGTEYGMILVLVLIAAIGGIVTFRGELQNVIQNITNGIETR